MKMIMYLSFHSRINRGPETQDSLFHKQKFLGFWNPDSFTWGQFVLNEVKIRMSHFASEKSWQSKMHHSKERLEFKWWRTVYCRTVKKQREKRQKLQSRSSKEINNNSPWILNPHRNFWIIGRVVLEKRSDWPKAKKKGHLNINKWILVFMRERKGAQNVAYLCWRYTTDVWGAKIPYWWHVTTQI